MIEFLKNEIVGGVSDAAKIFVTGDICEETVLNLTKDLEMCKDAGVKRLTFIINSPGGSVSDGMALYDMVSALNDIETVAELTGVCASAATYLPLACDIVRMNKNCDFMIHEPQGGFYGTIQQAEADLEYFSTLRDRIIALYCSKTNKSPEEIEVLLGEAKFLNAKTCKDLGFIDEIIGDVEEEQEEEKQEQEEEKQEDNQEEPEKTEEETEEEEEEKTENKVEKPTNLFSLDGIIALLKKNNISLIKATDDEFAKQEEVVNSLTAKVKDLETELEAKNKSYDEMVNRLEETKKDIDNKIQVAVADKIASFGYNPETIPAPEKVKDLSDDDFKNVLKETYKLKGEKAAQDLVARRERGEI